MSGIEQAVYQSLGSLNAAELEKLCEDLKLPQKDLDGRRGNVTLLNKLILRYLTSTEVEDSDDGGTPIFEQIYTYIESCTETKAKQQQQFLVDPYKNIPEDIQEAQPYEKPFQSSKPKWDDDDEKLQNLLMKSFKISGKIGGKDSLTYSSVIFQIENGVKKGYSEINIIDAVIKSISHESIQLRQYLEGKTKLNLATLSEVLRFHFNEKDATSLFTQLSTSKQNSGESPNDFVLRMMNLRQKIIFVSQKEKANYDENLVHQRFLHAVATGLKNNNIRTELREVLKNPKTTDQELLNRLTIAVADETEHQEKFGQTKKLSLPQVNSVEGQSERGPEKKKVVLFDELELIKAQLNEVTQLFQKDKASKSQNQSTASSSQQQSNPRRQSQAQRSGSSHPRANWDGGPNRCDRCIEDNEENCDHCFFCYSSEHLQAGCKERIIEKMRRRNKNQNSKNN